MGDFAAASRPSAVRPGTALNTRHPLANGLRAWWAGLRTVAGGKTVYSLTGLNHPTRAADLTWVPGVRGESGLNIPVTGNGLPTGYALTGPAFTVSAWMQSASMGGGGFGSVVFGVFRDNAVSSYCFVNAVTTGLSVWSTVEGYGGSSFGTISNGNWIHVAWVRTGNSGSYLWYVNGVLGATLASGAAWMTGGVPYLHVGGRPDVANCALGGQASDVIVHDRGLSQTEVRDLYDESRRGYTRLLNRQQPRVFVGAQAATGNPAAVLMAHM